MRYNEKLIKQWEPTAENITRMFALWRHALNYPASFYDGDMSKRAQLLTEQLDTQIKDNRRAKMQANIGQSNITNAFENYFGQLQMSRAMANSARGPSRQEKKQKATNRARAKIISDMEEVIRDRKDRETIYGWDATGQALGDSIFATQFQVSNAKSKQRAGRYNKMKRAYDKYWD
jgi:hypothetical protein